jgi:hypothetical protein
MPRHNMGARAAFTVATSLAMSACASSGNFYSNFANFSPNYAGPEPIMQRLVVAARQCGYRYVRTGPPILQTEPDTIGVQIGFGGHEQGNCLLRWADDNGVDLGRYGIVY